MIPLRLLHLPYVNDTSCFTRSNGKGSGESELLSKQKVQGTATSYKALFQTSFFYNIIQNEKLKFVVQKIKIRFLRLHYAENQISIVLMEGNPDPPVPCCTRQEVSSAQVCSYQTLCHQLCFPVQLLPCWEAPLGSTAI